jgi:hypothetical protein
MAFEMAKVDQEKYLDQPLNPKKAKIHIELLLINMEKGKFLRMI